VVAFFAFGSNAEAVMYQGAFQLLALCSVVLVSGVATGRGPFDAVLAHPVLVWIGRRSYGIYLWSWPTQVFLQEYWGLEGLALDAAVVALAVGLAALSFWLVEEPIRTGMRPAGLGSSRPRTRDPRIPRVAFSAMALVLVVGVIVGTSSGAPQEPDYAKVKDREVVDAALGDLSPAEKAALRKQAQSSTTVAPIDEGPPGPFTGATDVVVDPAASVGPAARLGRPLQVMVAGDSVGWSLAWELEGQYDQAQVAIKDRAVIGCGLMPREAKFIVQGRPPEHYPDLCKEVDLVELKGLGEKPDVVLFWLGAWEVYDQEYQGVTYRVGTKRYARFLEERMQERIDKYRGVGVATVMPLVPCFAENAARLGDERLDPKRIDWVNARVRAVAKRNKGWVRLIDPDSKLCDASGQALATTPDGIPLRQDGSHFDPPAARWFWNSWLTGQMGAAFDVQPPPAETTTTAPAPTTTGVPDTAGG
jgi:hypothetical protein